MSITIYTIVGGIVFHVLESERINDDLAKIQQDTAMFLGKCSFTGIPLVEVYSKTLILWFSFG